MLSKNIYISPDDILKLFNQKTNLNDRLNFFSLNLYDFKYKAESIKDIKSLINLTRYDEEKINKLPKKIRQHISKGVRKSNILKGLSHSFAKKDMSQFIETTQKYFKKPNFLGRLFKRELNKKKYINNTNAFKTLSDHLNDCSDLYKYSAYEKINILSKSRQNIEFLAKHKNPYIGFKRLLESCHSARYSLNASVSSKFYNKLGRLGLTDYLKKGENDLSILNAIENILNKNKKGNLVLDKRAVVVAKQILEHRNFFNSKLESIGVYIPHSDSYLMRQSHDPVKLIRDGFDGWFKDIYECIDIEKTFSGTSAKYNKSVCERIYNKIITETTLIDMSDRALQNIIKSKHRKLHFKSHK